MTASSRPGRLLTGDDVASLDFETIVEVLATAIEGVTDGEAPRQDIAAGTPLRGAAFQEFLSLSTSDIVEVLYRAESVIGRRLVGYVDVPACRTVADLARLSLDAACEGL